MAGSLIQVDSVDKVYRIFSNPRARLTASLARRMGSLPGLPSSLVTLLRRYRESVCREFYALRRVSFTVERGETVGIIGRNGSGKSTTLKIIAGTLQPTRGTVQVQGRVAAMLELASGFEQDFTGRENVQVLASILGLNREQIQERFADIVDFADIGDFLDQPTKTYSSGMLVRLAFAVHTAVDPEVLIIDEALSVGDEVFRRKCFARLDRLREQGTTILFVSHDLGSVVNLTNRALFFHEGEIIMEGTPKEVVAQYQRYCHVTREESRRIAAALKAGSALPGPADPSSNGALNGETGSEAVSPATPDLPADAQYDPGFLSRSRIDYAHHGGEIRELKLTDTEGRPANLLRRRQAYCFEYTIQFSESCENVTFAMLIKTMKGHELGGSRTLPWDQFIEQVRPGQVYRVAFHFQVLLMPGVYFLNAGVEGVIEGKRAYVHRILDALAFRVLPEKDMMPTGTVDFLIEPEMELLEDPSR